MQETGPLGHCSAHLYAVLAARQGQAGAAAIHSVAACVHRGAAPAITCEGWVGGEQFPAGAAQHRGYQLSQNESAMHSPRNARHATQSGAMLLLARCLSSPWLSGGHRGVLVVISGRFPTEGLDTSVQYTLFPPKVCRTICTWADRGTIVEGGSQAPYRFLPRIKARTRRRCGIRCGNIQQGFTQGVG